VSIVAGVTRQEFQRCRRGFTGRVQTSAEKLDVVWCAVFIGVGLGLILIGIGIASAD